MSTTSAVSVQAAHRDREPTKTARELLALATRTIDIGHSRIAYRVLGEGPDLVFIHGWPLHMGTFRDLAPLLASSFRCHLFDLPGAGASETSSQSALTLGAHAATARAVIDTLGLTRYAIVAHDSGGLVARFVAASDTRVRALVLGNTEPSHHHSAMIQFMKAVANTPVLGPLLLSTTMGTRFLRRSSLGFAGCFQNLDHIDGEFYDLFVAPMLADKRRASQQFALLRTLDPTLVDKLPDVHARIRCPTKLIWGGADPFFPLARARTMLPEFTAGATLDVIEGGKLFIHEEQPETFANLARPFLHAAF
jgi:pimeloyl-ACP methyl ester carboxylesterase